MPRRLPLKPLNLLPSCLPRKPLELLQEHTLFEGSPKEDKANLTKRLLTTQRALVMSSTKSEDPTCIDKEAKCILSLRNTARPATTPVKQLDSIPRTRKLCNFPSWHAKAPLRIEPFA